MNVLLEGYYLNRDAPDNHERCRYRKILTLQMGQQGPCPLFSPLSQGRALPPPKVSPSPVI